MTTNSMISSEEISSLIQSWQDKDRTLAEFISTLFKGKYLEIYVGDSYEEVSFEQTSQSYPAVFCGKIIDAFKECLIIETVYVSKDKTVKSGSIMFINERAIRGMCEVNAEYSLEDMILRSSEVSAIYSAYRNKTSFKSKKL